MLVGHNCAALDIPLLLREFQVAKLGFPTNALYWLDTRYLCQERLKDPSPPNFRLGTLYHHLFQEELKGAHDALADSKAIARILKHPSAWPFRGKVKDFVAKVDVEKKRAIQKPSPPDLEAHQIMGSEDELDDDSEEGELEDEMEKSASAAAREDGWVEKDTSDNKPFTGSDPGPSMRLKPTSALSAFLELWISVEDLVITETNRYAAMKRSARLIKSFLKWCVANKGAHRVERRFKRQFLPPWKPITVQDLRHFLAIWILAAAQNRQGNMSDWWSTDPLRGFAPVQKMLSRDRFLAILKYLHVANPYDQLKAGGDKVFKIRDLMTRLNSAFQRKYHPARNLTVDEMMIPFKGRLSIIQFMPRKPVKKGIRAWACSDATSGYSLNLDVYCGADQGGREEGVSLGESVVTRLTEPYRHMGYCVTTDRFFTSVSLFERLLADSIYATGTVIPTRKGFPKDEVKLPKGAVRGTTVWRMKGQLVASKSF